ncbi:MAG: AAA family ATPase [Patescibacteria group bacterium]
MLLFRFIKWYLYETHINLIKIWLNFFIFTLDFFGIIHHLKFFFSPWHLISVRLISNNRVKVFLFKLINLFIGIIIGMIARITTIISGLIFAIIVFFIGIAIELIWLFLVIVLIYGLYKGLLLYDKTLISITLAIFLIIIGFFAFQKRKQISLESKTDRYVKKRIGFDYKDKNLLNINGLNLKDIEYLKEWYKEHYYEQKSRARFWKKEFLDRIPPIGINWTSSYTPILDNFSKEIKIENYNIDDHTLFYQYKTEIEGAERILAQNGRNNVLLVGDEGIGKNLVLIGLERLIETGKSLPCLSFKRFLWLDINAILSGINNSGDLRLRLEAIFNEALYAGNIVLAIENIHSMLNTNFTEIADILLSFLKSNRSKVIATTTPEFLSKINRSDIINELGKVIVKERSKQNIITTLQEIVLNIEKQENIFIPYQSLNKIIELADIFSAMEIISPKKDIDFLYEAISFINRKNKKILEINDLIELTSEKTGIPLGVMEQDEREKLLNLEETFNKKIIGQSEAVKSIVNALKRARFKIRSNDRPIGTFLFLGATGVGKTTTAKVLAEVYFGRKSNMIRFDMSEYSKDDDTTRLMDNLSQEVKQNPYTMLLLDEIEKANSKILNLFLSILDEGIMTNTKGSKINFRHLIIIGTSNAGANLIQENIEKVNSKEFEEELLEHLQKNNMFKPEFLNRFDAIVTFKTLSKKELKQIAGLLLNDLAERLKKEHNIDFIVSDDLKTFLSENGYNPKYGARPMRRVMQDKIETFLADKFLKNELKSGDKIEIITKDLN